MALLLSTTVEVNPIQHDPKVRTARLQAMVAKYTSGLAIRAALHRPVLLFPKHIALIGYKGYFGSHLLTSFLSSPRISKVYCMDTYPTLQEPLATAHPQASKAEYIPINLALPKFALDDTIYKRLEDEVDVIVFTVWKPDLTSPLEAFETPYICGLRHVIDWSITSIRRPRVVFISSICAVGDWATINPGDLADMESATQSPNAPLKIGYSEAKWVCERMLDIACQRSAMPVSILRFGQIGGGGDDRKGPWAECDWLSSMLRASKVMRLMPEHVMLIDWAPVDQLADVVRDVVDTRPSGYGTQILNLAHPKPLPWETLLRTLEERLEMDFQSVSLPEWVRELEIRTDEDSVILVETGAPRFLDAYKVLGTGKEHEWFPTDGTATTLNFNFEPITVELLERWLRGWQL